MSLRIAGVWTRFPGACGNLLVGVRKTWARPYHLPTPEGNSNRYGQKLSPPVVQVLLRKQVLASSQALNLPHHLCGIVDGILPLRVIRVANQCSDDSILRIQNQPGFATASNQRWLSKQSNRLTSHPIQRT